MTPSRGWEEESLENGPQPLARWARSNGRNTPVTGPAPGLAGWVGLGPEPDQRACCRHSGFAPIPGVRSVVQGSIVRRVHRRFGSSATTANTVILSSTDSIQALAIRMSRRCGS
jgi:hypothetical protein